MKITTIMHCAMAEIIADLKIAIPDMKVFQNGKEIESYEYKQDISVSFIVGENRDEFRILYQLFVWTIFFVGKVPIPRWINDKYKIVIETERIARRDNGILYANTSGNLIRISYEKAIERINDLLQPF